MRCAFPPHPITPTIPGRQTPSPTIDAISTLQTLWPKSQSYQAPFAPATANLCQRPTCDSGQPPTAASRRHGVAACNTGQVLRGASAEDRGAPRSSAWRATPLLVQMRGTRQRHSALRLSAVPPRILRAATKDNRRRRGRTKWANEPSHHGQRPGGEGRQGEQLPEINRSNGHSDTSSASRFRTMPISM